MSHLVILVLRPDKQDYQGTAVTVDVARQLKVRNLVLAVNKAHARVDPADLKTKVEQAYDAPVLAVFPLSEDVAQVASDGVFSMRSPEHPISRGMARLARQVVEVA
jgi:MinD-like ATPase involved in chromosome partitioning or flagellar assembly